MRVACGKIVQLDHAQNLGNAPCALVGTDFLNPQAEGYVLLDGHVGKQRIALEHHADVALLRRERHQVAAIEQNAPAVDRGQPGDAAQ